jgi:hypothetical protein
MQRLGQKHDLLHDCAVRLLGKVDVVYRYLRVVGSEENEPVCVAGDFQPSLGNSGRSAGSPLHGVPDRDIMCLSLDIIAHPMPIKTQAKPQRPAALSRRATAAKRAVRAPAMSAPALAYRSKDLCPQHGQRYAD